METPTSTEASRPRRRMKVILTLALSGAVAGFLISYVFPPKYTSQSLVLVEGQEVPDNLVQPVITADFMQRLATMQQVVMATNRLRPMIERLGIVKPEEEGNLIGDIRQNMTIEPVVTDISTAAALSATTKSGTTPVPGFNVGYSSKDPGQAQLICDGLTSLLLEENLRTRSKVAQDQVDFFNRQVDDAKRVLDDQDARLANFKKQYMGHIATSPSVEEQYKALTRDNDNNLAFYKDLLSKLTTVRLAAQLENQGLGEQMRILQPAGLPKYPDFPDRSQCALGGLGAGLMLGIGRALWLVWKAKTEPHAAVLHGDSAVLPERRDINTE